MQRLISSLILIACSIASAQLPVIQLFQTQPSTGSPGPETLNGLAYYWNSSDLPVGGTVSNWVDRIQGAIWTNGATAQQPTNTAIGVYFDGGNHQLTNSVLNIDTSKPYTIFLIVKNMRNNVLADGFWTAASGLSPGFDFSNSPNPPSVADPNTLSAIFKSITNSFQDWIIPGSATAGATRALYTNNVSAKATFNLTSSGVSLMAMLAGQQAGGTHGNFYIPVFAVYTNDFETTNAAARTTLHTWATNSSPAAPYSP